MRKAYGNKNVKAVLVSSVFNSLGFSILWFATTWLIYGLGGSNSDLGLIFGLSSLLSITFSFLASYLADRFRRDVVIITSIGILLTGILLLSTANSLSLAFLGQILISIGGSASNPTMNALFSDSINADNRTRVFGTQFLLSETSNALGGVLGYFYFQGLDTSDVSTLDVPAIQSYIRLSVFAFSIVFIISLLGIRDSHALSEEEEKTKKENSKPIASNISKKVVYFLLATAFIIGFGAGFTIPYLPRFFFDIYGINLSNLSLLMAGVSVITAVWGKVNSNLAEKLGGIELIVLNQLVSVTLLVVLSTYPPLLFALAALIIRNAVMNGVGPIANAILMEHTPRKQRSKISAINQISWQVFFALGNIAGGRTVDAKGFRIPILTTASLYFLSTVIYWQIRNLINNSHASSPSPNFSIT